MFKNPWFTLVLGLMVGLALGYVLAENQPVPPAKAMSGAPARQQMPEGHPPMAEAGQGASPSAASRQVDRQADELRGLLAQNPNEVGLMVAIGNLYFDASRWEEARNWYEQALEIEGGDANVMTDLAVVYRNLKQPERALSTLDAVLAADPGHWQALYNRVVVLHFDLHRHDEAVAAVQDLEELAAENSQIPDLSSIANQVRGG